MPEAIDALTDAAGALVMLMMFGFRWRALCMSDAVTTNARTVEDWSGIDPSYYNRSRPSSDRAQCFQCLEQRSRSSHTWKQGRSLRWSQYIIHLPFSKPCKSNFVQCKESTYRRNNAALALSRPESSVPSNLSTLPLLSVWLRHEGICWLFPLANDLRGGRGW
jgi:hypothetical protein